MAQFVMLNENRDFRRIYAKAKSYIGPALVIYVMKSRAGFCRLGITTSKKLGSAVKRNRAKRVIKEAFRMCVADINKNVDIVIVARTRATKIKSTQVEEMMRNLMKKAGIIDS